MIDWNVLLHPPGIESALILLWIRTAHSPVGIGDPEGIGYFTETSAIKDVVWSRNFSVIHFTSWQALNTQSLCCQRRAMGHQESAQRDL